MPDFFKPTTIRDEFWTAIATLQSAHPTERGLSCHCSTDRPEAEGPFPIVTLTVLAPHVVRVRVAPRGEFLPRRSWAVTQPDEDWPGVPIQIQETPEGFTLTTEELTVQIQRQPFQIRFVDRQGQVFAQDDHIRWQTNVPGAVVSCINTKQIAADEQFYGFGERTGALNHRGDRLTCWTTDCFDHTVLTDEMYQAIPFFLSIRPDLGYGLFFNTTFWSQMDVGATVSDRLVLTTHAPELDYFLIYGPQPARIVSTFATLTGRLEMPPKWALGYHQCRWSYATETEVRRIAREFRDRQIPCDVIHLDIDYMQGYRVFTWHDTAFPDPQALIQDLNADGFQVVTIVDPGVKSDPHAEYTVFDQGMEQDYFVHTPEGGLFHGYVWPDRSVFPDFLRPEVRQWWGDGQKTLTQMGVAGIWNDMNEPAISSRPFGDQGERIGFPLDSPQGPLGERTTHAETHNLYGSMMARAAWEGLQRLRPGDRPFVLTRSGYAGIQRWSAVWTGDNQSRWDYLEMSLPMLCNLGLSGVPFVGADIGGFAGNASPELFARWMQVGVLYPFMRGHSMLRSRPHEPWEFGDRVETICRRYIELRYQLLPYLYTLFWDAATTGTPILRPLVYHYPTDPHTYSVADQVLLGPSLMAAPMMRAGMTHRAVYLPEGTWYDWWTGDRHDGPTTILAAAPLEVMPLYLKAGGVIPLAPVMASVEAQPLHTLTLRIAPGTGDWTLYEDDGRSLDYQQGAWCTTRYEVIQEAQQCRIHIAARRGNWQPQPRRIILSVMGLGEQSFDDDGMARQFIIAH